MIIQNKQLIQKIKHAVKEEKKYTALILDYLIQIEKRKLYLQYNCHSLHKFCTKILKYSDAEAAIRIKASRLMNKTPMIRKEIQNGSINLSNASKLHTFFKENPRIKKAQIIEQIKDKSCRQVDLLLINSSTSSLKTKNIKLSAKILNKLDKLEQSLEGRFSEVELIEILIDKELEAIEKNKPKRSERGSRNQRYISRSIKETIDNRAKGRCEHRDRKTGKRCEARLHLQYDHIRQVRKGGLSNSENIQKLCWAHNNEKELLHITQSSVNVRGKNLSHNSM